MIKQIFHNSIRALIKQIPYSLLNILGLTIGVASILILIVWISVETSYENFHKDRESIYRVALNLKTPTKEINTGKINAPAGPDFKKEFPLVEKTVRFVDRNESVIYKNKTNKLKVFYTDSTFFEIFTFTLLKGDKENCLAIPDGIVLTRKASQKIFGSDDPVGKSVMISERSYTVTAVAEDPPVNTNLQFECLAPLTVVLKKAFVGWGGGISCYTYLKLIKDADISILQNQITEFMKGAINNKYSGSGFSLNPFLQKITDIHLNTDTEYDLGEKGSRMQIFLFSGIGLLIILIACFNFVNISTALSFKRAKEVSIRKIFGSERKKIIVLFIFESATQILISLLIAFILARIMLPFLSDIIDKELAMSVIPLSGWLIIFILLFLFCTVFASFHSSFYLSSVNPLTLLTSVNKGSKRQITRNILVTFQYTISIALIICCLVIYSQMLYVKSSDKGFNAKDLLMVNLNAKTSPSYELIINRFSSIPAIKAISVSAGGSPGMGFTSNGYIPEGFEKPIMANAVYVDEGYLETMEISLVEGRNFRNPRADSNKVIINQTFAKSLGWDNPVGKHISRNRISYEVIGEVKDFNTASLHKKIEPIFISTVNEWRTFDHIILKYNPANIAEVLKSTEKIMKEIDPQGTFEYEFFEDTLLSSYSREQKLNQLFLLLSVIAIFISSLGLFGMATFATQSRLKEISIRKINGAGVADIFWKFNFELLKWIVISFVIASPLAYLAMVKWLENFAFKTPISLWLFLVSGGLTALLGLFTVSWATLKASRNNPVETLRKD